jgi:hypothetical protein
MDANWLRDLFVEEDRKGIVAKAIGTWGFSAHDFTDDELLYGALLMLKHALQMPDLDQWSMTDGSFMPKHSTRIIKI